MMNHTTPPQGTPESRTRSAYNPITIEDIQGSAADPFFEGLDKPPARFVGGILFVLLFFLTNHSPSATPLILLILAACMLFRMSKRERAIIAAPLMFSAVRLATQIAEPLAVWGRLPRPAVGMGVAPIDVTTAWVPLFLAACLFFTAPQRSKTGRVVFWYSLLILLSGLLPREGYTAVWTTLFYTLFLAMVVALIIDLNPNSNAARPLTPAPQATSA